MRTLILAISLFAAARGDAATISSGSWAVDRDRSSVHFTVTKFGRELVEGRFEEFEGSVDYDPANPERSSLRWSVRAASVDTGEPGRDRVLLESQFFHAARFPLLTFVSNRIRPLPDGRIHISGVVTIRGVRRPLVTTARLMNDDEGTPAFECRFVLNRHDFGVSGGSVSRHGISDTVAVRLRLVGVRQ